MVVTSSGCYYHCESAGASRRPPLGLVGDWVGRECSTTLFPGSSRPYSREVSYIRTRGALLYGILHGRVMYIVSAPTILVHVQLLHASELLEKALLLDTICCRGLCVCVDTICCLVSEEVTIPKLGETIPDIGEDNARCWVWARQSRNWERESPTLERTKPDAGRYNPDSRGFLTPHRIWGGGVARIWARTSGSTVWYHVLIHTDTGYGGADTVLLWIYNPPALVPVFNTGRPQPASYDGPLHALFYAPTYLGATHTAYTSGKSTRLLPTRGNRSTDIVRLTPVARSGRINSLFMLNSDSTTFISHMWEKTAPRSFIDRIMFKPVSGPSVPKPDAVGTVVDTHSLDPTTTRLDKMFHDLDTVGVDGLHDAGRTLHRCVIIMLVAVVVENRQIFKKNVAVCLL